MLSVGVVLGGVQRSSEDLVGQYRLRRVAV